MKRTTWFPASVKPVRVGMYECAYCSELRSIISRRYWSGSKWLHPADMSECWFGKMHGEYKDRWRGLAEQPK